MDSLRAATGLTGLLLVTTILMLAQFVSAPPVHFIGAAASPGQAQSASASSTTGSRAL